MENSNFTKNKNLDATYYDYNNENLLLKILGGFVILKKPLTLFILNLALIIFVLGLYTYIIFLAITTMLIMYNLNDKLGLIRCFSIFASVTLAISISSVRIFNDQAVNESVILLKEGIFHYDELSEEYIKIRKKRMSQLRFAVSFITGGFFCAALSEIIVNPFLKYIFGQYSSNEVVNSLLPYALVVPFDIGPYFNFILAYLSNSIAIFFMYCSYSSELETYTSCIVQIFVEFEVLNHSLKHINKRALLKIQRIDPTLTGDSGEILYDNPNFQKALYTCLRENILHHHAILRFMELLTPLLKGLMCIAILFVSGLVCCAIFAIIEDPKSQSSLLTDIFGFLPICYCGELIIYITTELGDALYATPWYGCDKKFILLLKIFMANTQKPLQIRPKFFNVVICLETFANMFVAGYKISNVLKVENSIE